MIDIIGDAFAIANADDFLHDIDDVVLGQHTGAGDLLATQATVELHATHGRQVVALAGEEQVMEQLFGRILGRRLARTHHPVDLDQRLDPRARRVDVQRGADIRTLVEFVDEQRLEFLDAGIAELGQQGLGDLGIGGGQQFTVFAGDVIRYHLADDIRIRHTQLVQAGVTDQLDVARGDALAGFNDDLAACGDIELCRLALEAFRNQFKLGPFVVQVEDVVLVEILEHPLVVITQRAQQDRRRQFAAAVDAHEQVVLRIELEVQP